MIWIITLCSVLGCATYAFNTEEQCKSYAVAKQVNPMDCTPMVLYKK